MRRLGIRSREIVSIEILYQWLEMIIESLQPVCDMVVCCVLRGQVVVCHTIIHSYRFVWEPSDIIPCLRVAMAGYGQRAAPHLRATLTLAKAIYGHINLESSEHRRQEHIPVTDPSGAQYTTYTWVDNLSCKPHQQPPTTSSAPSSFSSTSASLSNNLIGSILIAL